MIVCFVDKACADCGELCPPGWWGLGPMRPRHLCPDCFDTVWSWGQGFWERPTDVLDRFDQMALPAPGETTPLPLEPPAEGWPEWSRQPRWEPTADQLCWPLGALTRPLPDETRLYQVESRSGVHATCYLARNPYHARWLAQQCGVPWAFDPDWTRVRATWHPVSGRVHVMEGMEEEER